MGAAALLATVCGTLTALVLNYDKTDIDKGLYGFSAALVGVGVMLFFKSEFLSWVFILIGSVLASVLQHFFINRKVPAFTLPFVLITWVLLYCAHQYFPELMKGPSPVSTSELGDFTFAFKGYGQVIFQDKFVSGLLFFIAVFVSSPRSALYGLAGGIVSAGIATKLGVSISEIGIGLFSYNAVLCALVFAGKKIRDGIWVLTSVLLSLIISVLMAKFNLIQLTFPFVLAACITVYAKSAYEKKKSNL